MIATLGEALDQGWTLHVYCRFGRREGMKTVRECKAGSVLDVTTLVWTRGRAFPVSELGARMKCPRCGSRRVFIKFGPPPEPSVTAKVTTTPHWTKRLA